VETSNGNLPLRTCLGCSGPAPYRSPAEIVGLNPTGGMDLSVVSVVCCQVEVSAIG
jgi:hypothetical protein